MDILGLGMSLLDTIHLVDDFPAGSGVTEVRESALMGGGPVPTALCASAKLGARAGIIDRIGDDWRGDLIDADYGKFGVDRKFLERESGCRSGYGLVFVRTRDGERHLVFQPGDVTPLTSDELPREALLSCRILHLNGRHWPACIEAAKVVKKGGGNVSFDGGAHRFDTCFLDLLPLVDLLIVARDFAEQCAGTKDREKQLEALAQNGARIVGITDGERGSWFLTEEGETFHQAAFPAESLVDTTGCGDVFHGAFLTAVLWDYAWPACAEFASAAASLSASALGGRGFLPSRGSVEQLLG